MTRSHPPTLLKIAERTLQEECGIGRGDGILVAVSGGPDSSALLHVLSVLSRRLSFRLAAHGVDHGLRPEAGSELDSASALAERCNVPFTRKRVEVARGGNLQARARAARYSSLRAAARQTDCRFIATAHHAEDRAETVLIRLLRGAGPSGLAVLPPATGDLIRPILRAARADVFRHLERHHIDYHVDPSNTDRRFLRVRVRAELLPLMQDLSPGIVTHLNALADQLSLGPMPVVSDEQGRPVPLKRAHVDQIRRALHRGLRAAVRLPGGREVLVDPATGNLQLVKLG